MSENDKYESIKSARQEHIDAVLASTAHWKIVVAGPGTGKTHLFTKVIEGKQNTLTLSFVNALVEDLSLELNGLSEVMTLHGYARSALAAASRKRIEIYPKLPHVIREDAAILLGQNIDFEKMFHLRDDENEHLPFYRIRRTHYEHFSYSDVMFSAAKYFELNRDRIPTYDQVVVDEFQDFNPLEVSLIDLIADKSPILLAGDDDQALYDFKNASAEHIRNYHSGSVYESFNLPYCSRCTRVIIDAVNDVIKVAKAHGLLQGRIDKPYLYFDNADKDRESDRHNRIEHRYAYAAQIPWAVEQAIGRMAEHVRRPFSVLVISPTSGQGKRIATALENKGFENVVHVERDGPEPNLLDALTLILGDKDSNLGWRIAAACILEEAAFEKVLKSSDVAKPFVTYLDAAFVTRVRTLVKKLRQVRDGNVADADFATLLSELGIDPMAPAKATLQRKADTKAKRADAAIRKIPIKVTTVPSSKGLAADLVVFANFDDAYLIKNKDNATACDQDICNFVVALTRAKKKIVLISSGQKEPQFLSWIDKSRVFRMPHK